MKKYVLPLMLLGISVAIPLHVDAGLTFGTSADTANASSPDVLDTIVAVVNDDVITRRELETASVRIQTQLQQRKIPIPPKPVLEQQVLERLILSQLQARIAERNGIAIDDTTLNAAIEGIAQREKVSLTQLHARVEKDGLSFAQFRDEVRRELLSARLRQKLVDSQVRISDQDVESRQAQMDTVTEAGGGTHQGAVRQYHLAQILIAVPENASPAQIESVKRKAAGVLTQLRQGADFGQIAVSTSADRQALEGGDLGWRPADQLPTLFADVIPRLKPGQVSDLLHSPSGFHIVKLLEVRRGAAEAPSTPVTPAKAALITQTQARHVLIKTSPEVSDAQAQQRLAKLRQQLRNGEDFATLASAHSDDQVSKTRGGALGWVSPGMLVPEFERAMNALKPKDISAPFKTAFGWHIVQVLARRQVPASSEQSLMKVREGLLRQRADEEWELTLRRWRDEAYVELRLQTAAPTAQQDGEAFHTAK